MDDDAQVFFNDMALFGVPGDTAATVGTRRSAMYDERANLIVSPVLKSRWGHQTGDEEAEEAPGKAQNSNGAAAEDEAVKPGSSSAGASKANAVLACARVGCQYLAHDREDFGGFCCVACSEKTDAPVHDRRCRRQIAPFGAPRAPKDAAGVSLQQRPPARALSGSSGRPPA
mmetsp:Transcript_56637/g.164259  ORF Transcript_56637/g.164259 Transcript_56637/m.164259 type:complete len:172 (-) Transcript_56637:45-560(-)